MGIVNHTTDRAAEAFRLWTLTWAAIANGSQGAASAIPVGNAHPIPYRQASFQATGTFGTGGSVRLEGSNDGTNWVALSPAALTAPGFFAPLGTNEKPKFIRPNVTAGDGTTSINVVGFFN